ncbi:MAG: haloacid dehalogenase-like hydrolase [Verrucomicrobia bacterium]|nr:haloacid dehalogenase-like hydrolase [Verrucomicrobiota bacterium]
MRKPHQNGVARTLVRTGGAGVKAFARTFATEFGLHHGVEKLSFAGRTDTSLVREFFQLHELEPHPDNFARFFRSYVFWLDHFLHQLNGRILPGVEQFLAEVCELRARPLMGLLTGNIQLGAEIKLRHLGLWQHFVFGAFGDDHEDRNQLAVLARKRGSRLLNHELRGEEILVIGDTPADIACARAIDARCLAVATGGYKLAELKSHSPAWALEDLRQIRAAEICV